MPGFDAAAVDENGVIDWKRARAQGCTFAYLNATPGNSVWNQAPAARAAGMRVGPYWFPVIMRDYLSLPTQWERAYRTAQVIAGDLPWVMDVELPHQLSGTKMSRAEVCAAYLAGYDAMAGDLKYDPGLYVSRRVMDTDDSDTLAGGLNGLAKRAWLWLAYYQTGAPPTPQAWGADNWWIHQDHGDTHGLFGIRQVDSDQWHYLVTGMTGPRVAHLQYKLQDMGLDGAHSPDIVQGVYDAATKAAVCAAQRHAGLVEDGVVGPDTFAVIFTAQRTV